MYYQLQNQTASGVQCLFGLWFVASNSNDVACGHCRLWIWAPGLVKFFKMLRDVGISFSPNHLAAAILRRVNIRSVTSYRSMSFWIPEILKSLRIIASFFPFPVGYQCTYPFDWVCSTVTCKGPLPGQNQLNCWSDDPALNLLRNLRDVLLGNSGNGCVLWLAVTKLVLCFPWNSCQHSLLS